jgi:hypothetical protein
MSGIEKDSLFRLKINLHMSFSQKGVTQIQRVDFKRFGNSSIKYNQKFWEMDVILFIL